MATSVEIVDAAPRVAPAPEASWGVRVFLALPAVGAVAWLVWLFFIKPALGESEARATFLGSLGLLLLLLPVTGALMLTDQFGRVRALLVGILVCFWWQLVPYWNLYLADEVRGSVGWVAPLAQLGIVLAMPAAAFRLSDEQVELNSWLLAPLTLVIVPPIRPAVFPDLGFLSRIGESWSGISMSLIGCLGLGLASVAFRIGKRIPGTRGAMLVAGIAGVATVVLMACCAKIGVWKS